MQFVASFFKDTFIEREPGKLAIYEAFGRTGIDLVLRIAGAHHLPLNDSNLC
jgi:hypothetical protein